ncbi:FXYD domain-containing ion transport regulator 7 isoform X2 [Choloepus didactylus]|uniref:FXYD domain-containing ion transport regulator 7 isoform X2 n=1 Tax=Choloepus didactylus TaxID=27675 RepID=UPI00189C9708|nr:FXYD domain-containing ion transport regulator 7 isoform X2 [Choloepus didactylus]
MKRKELSAAPSAVCPAAGGRNTWRDGTQPVPATPACLGSCCSRAFTAWTSSSPLHRPGMATPTQAPTEAPREHDPFYYDYGTVQTVGMTLATILFLLGIIIIISKKVKCRKADSSPTCKSCLGNGDPPKEPVCNPDPGTRAASSWDPGVHPTPTESPRAAPLHRPVCSPKTRSPAPSASSSQA